jgi:hypothetical protein
MAQRNADRIELLLDRLGSMTRTFTEASERSTRRIDVQIKAYVDRGAKATDQTLAAVDRELQRQIAAMKRELPRLEHAAERVREAAPAALRPKAAPKDVPARAAATTRPAVKKAPPKKTTVKKTTAKRAAARAKKAPAGVA